MFLCIATQSTSCLAFLGIPHPPPALTHAQNVRTRILHFPRPLSRTRTCTRAAMAGMAGPMAGPQSAMGMGMMGMGPPSAPPPASAGLVKENSTSGPEFQVGVGGWIGGVRARVGW